MKFAYLASVGLLGLTACSPCRHLDCIASQVLAVNFVSSVDGSSLVGGIDPELSDVNIYCYKVGGNSLERVAIYIHGESVYLDLDYQTKTYYYEAMNKTDTVEMTYGKKVTECCGTVFTIETLILNGKELRTTMRHEQEITLRR